MPTDSATRTTNIPLGPGSGPGAMWGRRLFLSLLALIVLAGALGYLGVKSRSATVSSANGALTLRVQYAQVARAGLDVPFQATIYRRGGFDGDVALAVSSDYLQLFDRSAIDPEPSSATTTGQFTIWRFDQPPQDTLVVSLDLQVQGGRHWGRSGTVEVLGAAGAPIARTTVRTWLSP